MPNRTSLDVIELADIRKVWRIMREKDNTIPSETLDFIRDAAINEFWRTMDSIADNQEPTVPLRRGKMSLFSKTEGSAE